VGETPRAARPFARGAARTGPSRAGTGTGELPPPGPPPRTHGRVDVDGRAGRWPVGWWVRPVAGGRWGSVVVGRAVSSAGCVVLPAGGRNPVRGRCAAAVCRAARGVVCPLLALHHHPRTPGRNPLDFVA